jgi:hypothetical protein
MCLLFCNLGAWTFWNPQCLSRPVMGLLYLSTSRYPTCYVRWISFIKACDAVCVSSTRANPLRLDHRDGAWRRLPVIYFRAYGCSNTTYFFRLISRCVLYDRDCLERVSLNIYSIEGLKNFESTRLCFSCWRPWKLTFPAQVSYKVVSNFYNSCEILPLILLFQFQITFVGGRYLVQWTVWAFNKRTSAFVCVLQWVKSCL